MMKLWPRTTQAFYFGTLLLLGCETSEFRPSLPHDLIPVAPPPTFTDCKLDETRIVFVTSTADYQGARLYNNGSGGSGTDFRNIYADTLCAALAAKSTFKNEYEFYKAKWAAWLSFPAADGSTTNNAIDRINVKLTAANAKKSWSIRYESQCAKVFNDVGSLMASPSTIIDRDENGNKVDTSNPLRPVRVWTGTITGGRAAAAPKGQTVTPQCVDMQNTGWISSTSYGSYGEVVSSATGLQNWTNAGADVMQIATMTCDKTARLYCFQVDQD